jgi:hypothetical protein
VSRSPVLAGSVEYGRAQPSCPLVGVRGVWVVGKGPAGRVGFGGGHPVGVLREQPCRPRGGSWARWWVRGCCLGARHGLLVVRVDGWRVVGWWWVEICIVDASILVFVVCL